jgi:hypothetical protein
MESGIQELHYLLFLLSRTGWWHNSLGRHGPNVLRGSTAAARSQPYAMRCVQRSWLWRSLRRGARKLVLRHLGANAAAQAVLARCLQLQLHDRVAELLIFIRHLRNPLSELRVTFPACVARACGSTTRGSYIGSCVHPFVALFTLKQLGQVLFLEMVFAQLFPSSMKLTSQLTNVSL